MLTALCLMSSLSLAQVQYVRRSGDTMSGSLRLLRPGANGTFPLAIEADTYALWTSNMADLTDASAWRVYIRNTLVNNSRALEVADNVATYKVKLLGEASDPVCNASNRGILNYNTTTGRLTYCSSSGTSTLPGGNVYVAWQQASVSGYCATTGCLSTFAASAFSDAVIAANGSCRITVHTIVGGSGTVNMTLRNETAGADIVTVTASNTANTSATASASSLTWASGDVVRLNWSGGTAGTYNVNAECYGPTLNPVTF